MEYDPFGMPKPAQFEDQYRRHRTITAGRCMLLLLGLAFAGLIGYGVHHTPNFMPNANDEESIRNRMGRNLRKGRMEAALRDAERLITVNPREGHMVRGELLTLQRRHDEAIRHFDKAIELDPDNESAHLLRANSLGMTKRYREAIRDYDLVLARDEGRAMALNNRAYFRALERIDLEEAMTDVERAIEIEPNNGAYVDTRGYLHYLAGRHEAALADFEEALKIYRSTSRHPLLQRGEEQGEVYFHRGLAYRALGKHDLAENDFDKARQMGFAITDFPEPVPQRPPLMKAPPK